MNWAEALEIAIAKTNHERYRELTADDRPDCWHWREEVLRLAEAPPESYPSLLSQARNALGALGRVVGAALAGEPIRVSPEEHGRRWAICVACENLTGDKCKLCGCHMKAKTALAQERCPLDPPKWDRIEATT